MRKIIVTTTIHHPTRAILKYADMKDWSLIIIGDKKTPHKDYVRLQKLHQNVYYVSPAEQEKKYAKLSRIIGWNSIQRRSIGFIEAYKSGADIISTVDDDNIPYDFWGKDVRVNTVTEADYFTARPHVFDPLSATRYKQLWHRGYPIELLPEKNNVTRTGLKRRRVYVQADLWDGDPDVDAIGRIAFRPDVRFTVKRPFCSNRISPFNSQNTFLSRHVLPRYYLLPHVGRMDDIWGAYILQYYFPNCVIYNKATVYQDRNVQNVVKNLKDEVLGYEYTLKLLNNLPNYLSYLPEQTREFIRAWDNVFKFL